LLTWGSGTQRGPHTMLRAAGNVQKNNTKMLIRGMCNTGTRAVTPLLVMVFARAFCG